jgi:tetratricopeptide (TPR) repeat protein
MSDHFQVVNTLGATWDTVGWAYFRTGDLARAEKYINAAWLLLQHPVAADHLGQIYERQGKKTEAIRAYQLSLAVNRDQPDTRKRLQALGGADEDPPVRLRRGKPTNEAKISPEDELSHMRTTPLPELPTRMATAEFFLLISPSGVQGVRFIRGDDVLKSAESTLAKAHYPMIFPDEGPEKIVRRGILSCSKYTTPSCTFVLLLPANTTTN